MQAHEQAVVVLMPNHFNAVLYRTFKDCISEGGRKIVIAGRKAGESLTDSESQEVLSVDMAVGDVGRSDYGALIILDGATPDEMSASRRNLELVSSAFEKGKILGAVDRGVDLLVAALGARLSGKAVTGPQESQIDIEGVGATFIGTEIAEDDSLVTARTNEDIERFCQVLSAKLRPVGGVAA